MGNEQEDDETEEKCQRGERREGERGRGSVS